MPTLCLDVVDEDLHLFQGAADDFILDIFLVISQFFFSLNVLRGSDGSTAQATMKYCICQTRGTSNKASNNAMYFASVIPTATVPRFCENQLIAPPSPAPPLLVPIVYCPHISVARVSVRTHVHPAMPVPALGDAGVIMLLLPL